MSPSPSRFLALLGDSILDNVRYTRPEPDTAGHLRAMLGGEWAVELAAQDGATMDLLPPQLETLSRRADLAILSVGGNDAIGHLDILEPRASTTTQMLTLLQNIADDFEEEYRGVLEAVQARTERLIVCTIYEPPLSHEDMARMARVPLAILNDRIIRAATRLGLDVLDLRTVCTSPSDFVQEIEPSAQGAWKIAAAIATVMKGSGPGPASRVYAI